MTRGLALNVRGLVNPIRQKELTKILQGFSFAILTEIRRPFRLDSNWHTFCSECLGRGGAAVFLRKADFPTAHVVRTAEHAIAVDSGPFWFISLYVPCGKKVHDVDYVLEWIPPHHEHVLIAGDWNKVATEEEWHVLLQFRGLHSCPLPLDCTRVSRDEKTSLLDGVASTDAVVTKLMPWHLSDHLALIIKFGPDQPKAKHFPLKVLEDTVFQKTGESLYTNMERDHEEYYLSPGPLSGLGWI